MSNSFSKESILKKINEEVSYWSGSDVDNPDMSFFDLGLDSLDTLTVTMELENEFSIDLPDEEMENIQTPNQLCDLIYSKVN